MPRTRNIKPQQHNILGFVAAAVFVTVGHAPWGQAQVTRITDIRSGPASSVDPGTFFGLQDQFYGFSRTDELLIRASDDITGEELWKHDGTTVSQVANIGPGSNDGFPRQFESYKGDIYMVATNNNNSGLGQIWKYDGAGTSLVDEIDSFGSTSFVYGIDAPLTPYHNRLYFSAENGANFGGHGIELWTVNPNDFTTRKSDIAPGADSSAPNWFAVYEAELYFAAGNNSTGRSLWKFDGTSSALAVDLNSSSLNDINGISWLCNYNGKLYFAAQAAAGEELYSYDGTTTTLIDVNPNGSSDPRFLTVYNNKLFFGAEGGSGIGRELYSYDGTTLTLEANINPNGSSIPSSLQVHNGNLYYGADDGVNGFELHKFNGTQSSLVADIQPGIAGSGIGGLTNWNGRLVFSADDGQFGQEVWMLNEREPDCLVRNRSFEQHDLPSGGLPTEEFRWRGDVSRMSSGVRKDITPHEGRDMLEFIATGPSGPLSNSSQVWQLVDVSNLSSQIAAGQVEVEFEFYANRIEGDGDTDTLFQAVIQAHNGLIADSPINIGNFLDIEFTNLFSDGNVNTWELVTAFMILPAGTEFIAVSLNANEDVIDDTTFGNELDGHFADSACIKLHIVPEPSSIVLLVSAFVAIFLVRSQKSVHH